MRATIIVSDEEGYNLVRHLISGINYNRTICNIILIKDSTEGDLEEQVKTFIKKHPNLVLTLASNDDLIDKAKG